MALLRLCLKTEGNTCLVPTVAEVATLCLGWRYHKYAKCDSVTAYIVGMKNVIRAPYWIRRYAKICNDIIRQTHKCQPNICSLILYNPVVTICTTTFNIQQFYIQPTQCIYVYCMDLRINSDYFPTQQLLTGFYNRDLTPKSPVVTTCTTNFNIHKPYVLPIQCIYEFCMDLRKISYYFPIQH
jgi:hypothetical protein